jgi:phospholipase D1/2
LHTMGYGRSAFCEVLRRARVNDRVPLVAALTGDSGINLHSKLAIFDDRALTVGSANLNRRSMGFDVECNLILEATTAEHRATIEKLRSRLLAEHLGAEEHELADALRTQGLSRLPEQFDRSRRLVRVDARSRPLEPNLGPLLAPIFDPEEPWASMPVRQSSMRSSRWIGTVILLGLVAAAAVTGTVVDDDFSGLTAVEQMLSSLLRS